ncbi:Ger(x)C family spore germination C-terminal domain-containing protein [Bacillus salipaludis]|uniref:Ger(X)C family spore germination C-terminal domain-containing protein n=1 Tax=Bacillus salipaludis TaxID=2547811 RepID=A0ABW8RNL8_9BACI
MQKQFEDLLKKIQKNKIDPIGFGLYARAYQYEQFKKMDNDWGKAFAESDIHVSVKVKVNSDGAVRSVYKNWQWKIVKTLHFL